MDKIDPELLKRMMMGDYSASNNGDKNSSKPISKSSKKNREIDLHASRLFAHMPPRDKILSAQLSELKSFLSKAVQSGWPSVVVIHGKGEDILAQEVQKVLKSMKEIRSFQVLYDAPYKGGATRAHFR